MVKLIVFSLLAVGLWMLAGIASMRSKLTNAYGTTLSWSGAAWIAAENPKIATRFAWDIVKTAYRFIRP